jgi:hypothetical protein
MNNIINKLRTSYGHLSDRLIEEYDRRQYMRFYKGKLIDIDNNRWPRAKVSLATACFYMGQGFGYIRGLVSGISNRIGQLRTVGRNRLK